MSTIIIAAITALLIGPFAALLTRRRWRRRNLAMARLARLREIVDHQEPAPQRTSPADSALLRGPGG